MSKIFKITNEYEDVFALCDLRIFMPTLNRPKESLHNFSILVHRLNTINTNKIIEIVISENCSDIDKKINAENFADIVKKYPNENIVYIFISREQRLDIGSHLTWVSFLDRAKWVMWLGDDDILSGKFLKFVVSGLDEENVMGFNPQWGPISAKEFFDEKKDFEDGGRETTIIYDSSNICPYIIHRGHQLSGLTYRREVLLEASGYLNSKNMYPWMAYQIIALNKGRVKFLSGLHCKVTSDTPKLFSYGKDGLFPEISESIMAGFHDNYRLAVYYAIRVLGEIAYWRIFVTSKFRCFWFFRILAMVFESRMDKIVLLGLSPIIFYREIRSQAGRIKRALIG